MTLCNSISMASGNTYNENCQQQADVLVAALPLFDDIKFGANVTIADYGCSQGSNSLIMMQYALDHLPPSSTASLIFEDLPSNEFSSLIKLLPQLYDSNPTLKIYPSLIPKSFYESVVAPGTVDVGFTSCTIHWLKRLPAPKPSGETVLEYYQKRPDANAPAAKEDLREFLAFRGHEIKRGGYLIIGCLGACTKEELASQYKDATAIRHRVIFRAAEKLANEGKIPQKAMEKIYIPMHDRTEDDFLSGIAEFSDTWVMEKYERKMIFHPAYYRFLEACKGADQNKKKAATKEYAGTMVDWILAVIGDMVKSWWLESGVEAKRVDGLFEELRDTARDFHAEEDIGGSEMPIMYTRLRRV
ncbi:hypothetical protein TWF788_003388 [Orbilia oligospora]|uniref:S-adenosyl-L-methionine-dependent methyltransferase n=1 Tax=Orbilia oligospora TaxID=2813651 RepID=A0A7C8K2L2_ORBOL|nr:hypothetical protein TWF788_003388 [Orbilia oligospora]